MATIRLECDRFGCYEVTDTETGESLLFQSDWSFPYIARDFGWDGNCDSIETDDINDAVEFLDDNDGKEIEDCGYFV